MSKNSRYTTDGEPPADGLWDAPAPKPAKENGQNAAYWVLPPEERAKGYIRPVRQEYVHVGRRAPANLRDLTPKEAEDHSKWGYVKFEVYPESELPKTGRFWTQSELDELGGCGEITKMDIQIAETYAVKPDYYGSTFCCRCGKHLPVEEFVWRGTNERVGS